MFINRKEELAYLEREHKKAGPKFVVIYGRRRTGKTTLIKEFLRGKSGLYFLADKQIEKELIRRFALALFDFLKEPQLEVEFKNWDNIFKYFLDKIGKREKIILVIDEFQYLAKANPAFPSILQRLWDEYLKKTNIFLIICGSLISMMYKTALSYKSPLYGRRTGQINLRPIKFKDFKYFFKKLSFNKLVEFYSVTGGIPKYIETFNEIMSLYSNIKENILNKEGLLYAEPRFILGEEIVEPLTYFSILSSIAWGEHKIGKIGGRLGVDAHRLTAYLETLIDLGILKKEVPIDEKYPAKSKKGLYFIVDDFFRFWFKYVFPYQSQLEMGNVNYVLDKIKMSFPEFISISFEKICQELLLEMSRQKKIPVILDKIGKWWSRGVEIDIVGLNEKKKTIIFGECKWSDRPMEAEVYINLRKKASEVEWNKGKRKEYFILFSKSGFTKKLKELAGKENIFLVKNGKLARSLS